MLRDRDFGLRVYVSDLSLEDSKYFVFLGPQKWRLVVGTSRLHKYQSSPNCGGTVGAQTEREREHEEDREREGERETDAQTDIVSSSLCASPWQCDSTGSAQAVPSKDPHGPRKMSIKTGRICTELH